MERARHPAAGVGVCSAALSVKRRSSSSASVVSSLIYSASAGAGHGLARCEVPSSFCSRSWVASDVAGAFRGSKSRRRNLTYGSHHEAKAQHALCDFDLGIQHRSLTARSSPWLQAARSATFGTRARPGSKFVSSRHMAKRIPAIRRASATAAICFPRRAAMRRPHTLSPCVPGAVPRISVQAASTSSHRTRALPRFVKCPRCCFSPELLSPGTSPR